MKQLTVVVKPFRAEAVLKVIADLGISTCVVREAKGYSRQKGYLERYVGSEYSQAFLPKVEITVWVEDEQRGDGERLPPSEPQPPGERPRGERRQPVVDQGEQVPAEPQCEV